MLRLWGGTDMDTPLVHRLFLFDDLGFTNDPKEWIDLLAGQTSVRVEWSKTGIQWGGTTIDLVDDENNRKVLRFDPSTIADGTEYLVRFVIAGVTHGPISVRYYS